MDDEFVDNRADEGGNAGIGRKELASGLLGMLLAARHSKIHDDLREAACDILRVELMGGGAMPSVVERINAIPEGSINRASRKLMQGYFADEADPAVLIGKAQHFGSVVEGVLRGHAHPDDTDCHLLGCPTHVGDTAEALLDWLADHGPEPVLDPLRATLLDMRRIAGTREPALEAAVSRLRLSDAGATSSAILGIATRHSMTFRQAKAIASRIENAFKNYLLHATTFGMVGDVEHPTAPVGSIGVR